METVLALLYALVSVPSMSCVSFFDLRTGSTFTDWVCVLQPNFFSFLKLCVVFFSWLVCSLAACWFVNIESKALSFHTSLRFLLPPLGSFPILCFISVHGDLRTYHLSRHISRQDWHSRFDLLSPFIKRTRTWWDPCHSQPAHFKSHLANTKVSRKLAGQNDYFNGLSPSALSHDVHNSIFRYLVNILLRSCLWSDSRDFDLCE
jgi:hypothetical protein